MACWLIFDIDRREAASAWEDAYLPPPTYIAINPSNGHAHLGYALSSPVCMTDVARSHPQRYLAAIERAYIRRLKADVAFNGPLAKNPLNDKWRLWEPANCPAYELGLLAEYVDLPKREPPRPKREGYSRNCDLFETLMFWAVRAIRNYWDTRNSDRWREDCIQKAVNLNVFQIPLGVNEAIGIGRSVAKWTWRNTTPSGFHDSQARVGRRGGVASGKSRRAASELQRAMASELAQQGLSMRAIATELGVSHPTVSSWLREGGK